ncbi:sensor histidine kinase [Lentzea sp. HUAS12]|uniref:sensor histidine kinase n=1 Tax=Lentzea sp. HUAS12 TaxID=2951806 RepID=UPI0020A0622B|nr:sensor histidine kinase [Lentzea sp. HUAS12]USX55094.1 sensor histidine kinase [Lentzea sp. HUAS12]
MKFAEVKQFLLTGAATLFAASRLVRTPPPARWRHVRLVLTLGLAALVVALDVAVPPGRYGWDYPVPGWWFTGIAAASVVVSLRNPLWAWRGCALLLAVTPMINWLWSDDWLWPWSPGLVVATTAMALVVGQNYRQVVLAWVFLFTVASAWVWSGNYLQFTLMAGAVVGGALVLGNAMRLRRIAEADSAEHHARATKLEERAVIARELHDVVAHHMSVLALRAGSARYRFDGLPSEVVTEFDEMQSTAREGLTEMRRLLGVLRNENGELATAPQPRVEEIADLVDRLRGAGVAVSLEVEGNVRDVPAGVALSAYRIAQEALSNAVRHAPGSTVDVEISATPGELRLVVANGAPTAPVPASDGRTRHGLLGMRERVTALGGAFRAGPDGGGFVVAVTLPLNGG